MISEEEKGAGTAPLPCAGSGKPESTVVEDCRRAGFFSLHAIERPTKRITVIGLWLLLGPLLFTPLIAWEMFAEDSAAAAIFGLLGLGVATVLYRTSKNYFIRPRR